MNKTEGYRQTLRSLAEWDDFLLAESGLPGPRSNLELLQAVADEGDEQRFKRYLSFSPAQAPTNSPAEFLAACGVVGLGRIAAEGPRPDLLAIIRCFASDPRWRLREAVAMALQRIGRRNMDFLLQEMERWRGGNLLDRRAVVAALCEPDLLAVEHYALAVLNILDQITSGLRDLGERKSEPFRVLRQTLGYGWSVAVAACPADGKESMEKWFSSPDADVRWIMAENLKKKRLERMDRGWVEAARRRLAAG
jgi:hypothetical protein